jgi:hypothetical protein
MPVMYSNGQYSKPTSTVTFGPGQVPQLVISAEFDAFGATQQHARLHARRPQSCSVLDVIDPLPQGGVFMVS